MSVIKHPLARYDVSGNSMIRSGEYMGYDVAAHFERMSEEDIAELEGFLKSKGWMR